MPVLNGVRAWLETPTTLKVPELNPVSDEEENSASSYIVVRPGESFSIRYDHIPLEGFDVAWRLSIRSDGEDGECIEQWGGPPLEMRKSRGVVKVRAMRISEDGKRFREFAWASSDEVSSRSALQGTITLSLHLCLFAEATTEVAPSPTPDGRAGKEMLGSKSEEDHPILAPPATRPTPSKLWTWYWRDENPKATFQFKYATKEALQSLGIVPSTKAGGGSSIGVPLSDRTSYLNRTTNPSVMTHKPRISSGSMFASSPADLIRRKQSLSVSSRWRQRGLSVGSDESDSSSGSSSGSEETSAAAATNGLFYDH